MILCSFGYFSVPVVTKSDDKDANVASTTVDDGDANMETASLASTSLVSNPHVLILYLDFIYSGSHFVDRQTGSLIIASFFLHISR